MKDEDLKKVFKMLDELSNDISVPRNIRRKAEEAKNILTGKEEPIDVRIASIISMFEELLSDPNIPTHGRTAIYYIISSLDSLTTS
ncbi:MAG TPA: hypothetical protein ENI52_05330 [Thermoplasmata archaeon]|nr:hypothetical protein [Thermoplasmata archaeon]